jgi:hypothetical protein
VASPVHSDEETIEESHWTALEIHFVQIKGLNCVPILKLGDICFHVAISGLCNCVRWNWQLSCNPCSAKNVLLQH